MLCRCWIEKETQAVEKMLNSLIMRNTGIKTTKMPCHASSWQKFLNTTITSVVKNVEQWENTYTLAGSVNQHSHFGKIWHLVLKFEVVCASHSACPKYVSQNNSQRQLGYMCKMFLTLLMADEAGINLNISTVKLINCFVLSFDGTLQSS